MSEPTENTFPAMHFALLIVGGLCLGMGILNLYYSFGWPGGNLNSNFAIVGFNGFSELEILPAWMVSFPLVLIGAVCLIAANATAWRQTGGY